MKTPVTCGGCHRQYEVDDRFAGKTVKCPNCGKLISIPAAEPAAAAAPLDFDEYQLGDPLEPAPSSFRASPGRSREERAQGQGRGRAKKKTSQRLDQTRPQPRALGKRRFAAGDSDQPDGGCRRTRSRGDFRARRQKDRGRRAGVARGASMPLRLCVRDLHRIH